MVAQAAAMQKPPYTKKSNITLPFLPPFPIPLSQGKKDAPTGAGGSVRALRLLNQQGARTNISAVNSFVPKILSA